MPSILNVSSAFLRRQSQGRDDKLMVRHINCAGMCHGFVLWWLWVKVHQNIYGSYDICFASILPALLCRERKCLCIYICMINMLYHLWVCLSVKYLISLKSCMPTEPQIVFPYSRAQRRYMIVDSTHYPTDIHSKNILKMWWTDCKQKYWHILNQINKSTDLFVDLLEEGNLLLEALNAPLQVQPGQSGIVYILDTNKETSIFFIRTTEISKSSGGTWNKGKKVVKRIIKDSCSASVFTSGFDI